MTKVARVSGISSRLGAVLSQSRSMVGLILIVVLAAIFSPQRGGVNVFLSPENLSDALRAMTIVGLIALGMTLVILTAGIDLSVGSILALSTCVVGRLLTKWTPEMGAPMQIAVAVLAALAACTVVGMVSGVVIARIGVPPFIVTLAAMIGIRGLAKVFTNNATMDIGFGGQDAAAKFADIVSRKPFMIATYVVFAVIFAVLLARTVFGRYVRAIGDNEKAARYSGLPIVRTKVWVYALTGLLCGIAGILQAAQAHQGDPNVGNGYELDAIAAVVIGGTSLAGGKGTIVGTIVGTLIVGLLTNILGLRNVDSNVQMMVKAVIIILAVWLQKQDKAD